MVASLRLGSRLGVGGLLGQVQQLGLGQRRAAQLGELAGFQLVATVSREASETVARLELAGVPRSLTFSGDEIRDGSALGILTPLENLSTDLSQRAEQAERSAGESRQEAVRATARLCLPFEHASRTDSLRQRLAEIDARLAPPEDAGGVPAVSQGPTSLASVLDVSFPAGLDATGVMPVTTDATDVRSRVLSADAVEVAVQAER